MRTARKMIDWRNQSGDELARQLVGLPEGRYVLVPENELAAGEALTPDEEDGLIDALASLDRGEGLPAEQVLAEMRARAGQGRSRPASRNPV
jgi:hypothetical protein